MNSDLSLSITAWFFKGFDRIFMSVCKLIPNYLLNSSSKG